MYNSGDAVLRGCDVTSHLYKWLFWSGTSSADHPYSLQTQEPTPHSHKRTHFLTARKVFVSLYRKFLHIPVSLAFLVGSIVVIVYVCSSVCMSEFVSLFVYAELSFCYLLEFWVNHLISFQLYVLSAQISHGDFSKTSNSFDYTSRMLWSLLMKKAVCVCIFFKCFIHTQLDLWEKAWSVLCYVNRLSLSGNSNPHSEGGILPLLDSAGRRGDNDVSYISRFNSHRPSESRCVAS